ncbi:MAG: hypothetical protein GQ546_13660 [Gammaproteobacteria bacterium]|nr:hypothetical protein [Gammaproteobacteria bacterium]
MNTIDSNSQAYVNLVQKSVHANSLNQVAEAKQAGDPVDVEQLHQSNQFIRDTARETGVELYSQQLKKQSFETYVESSQQLNEDEEENSSNDLVYTYNPQVVNDSLQTAQKRALGVSLYENLSQQANNNSLQADSNSLNVYV